MTRRNVLLYLVAIAWCGALLTARIVHTGTPHFLFLAWNLFLSTIPLAFSLLLTRTNRWILALPLLGAWLLFLPNAPYVLTDLLHLKPRDGVPLWYDLLFLTSCAIVALFLGFHSLHAVQEWLTRRSHRAIGWIAAVASLFLSGFGIYLGRFLRWNSWDVVHNPLALAADIAHRFVDPFAHPRTWIVTIGFGTTLTLAYLFFRSLEVPTQGTAEAPAE